jgi:large subunit ribosomal protein L31
VWSGNHPFYTGTQKIIDTEGRVDRFLKKYGMLDTTAAAPEAPAATEAPAASKKKK